MSDRFYQPQPRVESAAGYRTADADALADARRGCYDGTCRPQAPRQDVTSQLRGALEQERAALYNDPSSRRERLGNSEALRDSSNNLRDIRYGAGDARTRTLGYDGRGELNRMAVESRSAGLQVWQKAGHNVWIDQNRRVFHGEMKVDQQTGVFSWKGSDNVRHTYSPTGRADAPEDRAEGPARSGRPVRGVRDSAPDGRPDDPDADVRRPGDRGRGVRSSEGTVVENQDFGSPRQRADAATQARHDTDAVQTYGREHLITDRDNYRENLWGAAEGRPARPVVMVFGHGGNGDSPQVNDAIRKAKAAANGKADFMYVDLDKVDPRSPIGQYAQREIEGKFGTPMTIVFTQKQGEGNTPVIPERPMHWQPGRVNQQQLNSAVDQAVQIQAAREIKTGRDRTRPLPAPEDTVKLPTTQDLIKEASKPWKDQHPEQLMKNIKPEDRAAFVKEAVEKADSLNNPRLSAQIRALVGFAEISWGAEAKNQGNLALAEEHFLRGSEYMMSAGVYNKDIYRYPGFTEKFRASELPGTAADSIIERGLKDPKWFFPTAEQERTNPNAFRDARLDPVTGYYKFLKDEFNKPKRATTPANDPYRDYGAPRRDTTV